MSLLQNSLTILALVTFLAVLACYAYFGLPQFSGSRKQMQAWSAKIAPHLSILFCILVASWAWGFYLDHFQLLYSNQGVVYGAGYTADHVTRIAYWMMLAAAVGLCTLRSPKACRAARHGVRAKGETWFATTAF